MKIVESSATVGKGGEDAILSCRGAIDCEAVNKEICAPPKPSRSHIRPAFAILLCALLAPMTSIAGSDKTPPSVPANVAANAASCNQAALSWSPSTDPTINGQTTSG